MSRDRALDEANLASIWDMDGKADNAEEEEMLQLQGLWNVAPAPPVPSEGLKHLPVLPLSLSLLFSSLLFSSLSLLFSLCCRIRRKKIGGGNECPGREKAHSCLASNDLVGLILAAKAESPF